MFDRTNAKGRNPSAELIRKLPDEKLTEITACVNGQIQDCPECGELTAFPGRPTYNDSSTCHNCGYRVLI